MVFLQPEQCQMPKDLRRTVLRPQNVLIRSWSQLSHPNHQEPRSSSFDIPDVAGVLRDFQALDDLSERSTVSIPSVSEFPVLLRFLQLEVLRREGRSVLVPGTVFADNADLYYLLLAFG